METATSASEMKSAFVKRRPESTDLVDHEWQVIDVEDGKPYGYCDSMPMKPKQPTQHVIPPKFNVSVEVQFRRKLDNAIAIDKCRIDAPPTYPLSSALPLPCPFKSLSMEETARARLRQPRQA